RRAGGAPDRRISGSSERPFDWIHLHVYDTAAFRTGPPELLERRADERRQLGGALHDDPPYAVASVGARRIDLERRRGAERGTDPRGQVLGLGRVRAPHGDDGEPAERRGAELLAGAELVRV